MRMGVQEKNRLKEVFFGRGKEKGVSLTRGGKRNRT